MINKPLGLVTWNDVLELKNSRVAENRRLEYMLQFPGTQERDALLYLKVPKSTGVNGITMTICAFANSEGGDLLIGVSARKGIPVAFPGIPEEDEEELKRGLETWIGDNLEPRLPFCSIKLIPIPEQKGRVLLLVRVPKSARAPHRHKKSGHFYGRDEKGNYRYNMRQLRQAFIFSETIIQKIQNFHASRLIKIGSGQTPIAIQNGITMVMHIVPASVVFDRIDRQQLTESESKLFFLQKSWARLGWKDNAEGRVLYAETDGKYHDYIQYFRDSAFELVVVFPAQEDIFQSELPADEIGRISINFVDSAVKILKEREENPAYYIFISFLKMRGAKLNILPFVRENKSSVHIRDSLMLPEILVDDGNTKIETVMRFALDRLWQAFGYERCLEYDDEGNWVGTGIIKP